MLHEDENFIYDTWLKGLYFGNEQNKKMKPSVYFDYHRKIIDMILGSVKTMVKIVCLKEDPEVVLGYSVFEDHILHYIFIKHAWRGIGLTKYLLPEKLEHMTHTTPIGESFLRKKFPKISFKSLI